MALRLAKPIAAVGLLAAMWGLNQFRGRDARAWVRAPGAVVPVRITRFYANVGRVSRGEKAMLCYGVENARTVRISPLLEGVFPSHSRCIEVTPEHTTHYTILAEGYDGAVATRSLTLPVEDARPARTQTVHYAFFTGEMQYNPEFAEVEDTWRHPAILQQM